MLLAHLPIFFLSDCVPRILNIVLYSNQIRLLSCIVLKQFLNIFDQSCPIITTLSL